MKVLALIPVDVLRPNMLACIDAVNGQNYKDFSLLIHQLAPKKYKNEVGTNHFYNITVNRRMIKQMALTTHCDWFWWVDSDTIVPEDALYKLISYAEQNNCKLVGGWYKMRGCDNWVAGNVVDGELEYFKMPVKGITENVDLLGLGCCLMHRDLLKENEFDLGLDRTKDNIFPGECRTTCEKAKELGFIPTLIDLICLHQGS